MSTVELAEDTLLGRQVALKRMHTPDDVRGHSRLRREALVGASLTHPNLVSIFDILTTDHGEDVIVMEYVEGQTLADAVQTGAKPDVGTTLKILAGVSAALDAIHEQGIIHRDVKPANILLGDAGSVKLADLGIAAVLDRTQITTAGTVLGTFSYMAPEQLEGDRATPAVDVYALAAVAFEALSGRRARNEPNPVALAHAISTQPPPDLRQAWPAAPPAAAEVLKRAMSRNPAERPRSA
ncbi:MAG: serine/threonine protein kinase, partial [Solirubrobacterales bacterium]|nr:serine/threonine protein kinase [Solirubrobacterales bacterium]